jgi:SepF-like predicted cell division protein (DUF552 family)
MVYLGLQDDDEYGYDGYGAGHRGYEQGGYDQGHAYDPAHDQGGHDQTYDAHAEPRGAPGDDRYGGAPRAYPGANDVRPIGDARADTRTVALRDHPGMSTGPGTGPGGAAPLSGPGSGDSAVRPLPRDDAPQPSGVTVSRPAVVRAVPTTAGKVHVIEPRGFNDAQEVGDRVKSNQAVILNLQGANRELRRRLIDFSSGLAYAMGGSMSRVADSVFLITPLNVQLSEEEKERLEARGLYTRD